MKKILVILIAMVFVLSAGWYAYSMYFKEKLNVEAVAGSLIQQPHKPIEPDDNKCLYPAYEMANGVKKWGYIDDGGKFVISPVYEMA